MKVTTLTKAIALTCGLATFGAAAANQNQWENEAQDGWIDGKAEATLLFNGNLNNFDINTDVKNGVVILTGQVENDVDKRLAAELVRNIDGVQEVDNELTVVNSNGGEDGNDFSQDLIDSKVATVLKTSMLLDPDVSGTDINVEVEKGTVTLTGDVESDSMRDLAIMLAENTEDVSKVIDELKVVTQ